MQLSEPTTLGAIIDEKPLCNKDKEQELPNSECRIGKKGSPGELDDPTAERLYQNMKKAEALIPSDPPKKGDYWDLDQCTPLAYPLQSHHLIPKMHLPKHKVCVWLAQKKKNADWELEKSTNYDTDDARNGMSLPFASNTYQYKNAKDSAEKDQVCNTMMEKTKKQLHQGSHTYDEYDGGEEPALHENEENGYLGAVDQLLKVVNVAAMKHYESCNDCKKSTTKPIKVRPLERIVNAIHQASGLMGNIITANKKFVSKRAANYFQSPPLT